MINTRMLYDRIYNEDIKKLKSLKSYYIRINTSLDIMWNKLEPNKIYFNKKANLDFAFIKKSIKLEKEIKIVYSLDTNVAFITDVTKKLSKLIKEIKAVNAIKFEIDKLNSVLPTLEVFKTIIFTNNYIIRRNLIDGQRIALTARLGCLEIIRKKSDKQRIDWNASNILKRQLIKQDRLPYKVTERCELGNPIKDNGGEKWFVYADNINCWISWVKKTSFVANKAFFSFKPSAPFITELNVERKSKNNVDLRYKMLDYVSSY